MKTAMPAVTIKGVGDQAGLDIEVRGVAEPTALAQSKFVDFYLGLIDLGMAANLAAQVTRSVSEHPERVTVGAVKLNNDISPEQYWHNLGLLLGRMSPPQLCEIHRVCRLARRWLIGLAIMSADDGSYALVALR